MMISQIAWFMKDMVNNQIPFFKFVRYIFLARYAELGKYDRQIKKELDKCKFNQEQRDFIGKWVRKEMDLVYISDRT